MSPPTQTKQVEHTGRQTRTRPSYYSRRSELYTRRRVWHRPYPYIAIAALVFGAWFFFFRNTKVEESPKDLTIKVQRGDLPINVPISGSVESQKAVNIVCEVEGSSTIIYVVGEGEIVSKGDKLVELDSADLRDNILKQEIVVHNAHADMVGAQEKLAITENKRKSDLNDADLKIDFAEVDLEKYEKADRERAIYKAQMNIDIYREELKRLENKLEWTRKLADKGYVTRSELEGDELAKMRAEMSLKDAKQALDVLNQYEIPRQLKQLQVDLEEANRNRERVDRRTASEVSQAQADVDAKKMSLELGQTRLEKLKHQLEKTVILAPQDGMVVYPQDRWARREPPEVGNQVRERQVLLTLPNLSAMQVRGEVHESVVDQVSPGLGANVIIDAFAHRVWKGTVKMVAAVPDSQHRWLNPDLKVYSTVVTIDGQDKDVEALRPGMSARLELLLDRRENVLKIPVQSVARRGEETFCFVVEGGKHVMRKIKVGKNNDTHIEVVSGLSEGEEVLLYAPQLPELAGNVEEPEEERGLDEQAPPEGVEEGRVGPREPAGEPRQPPGGPGETQRRPERKAGERKMRQPARTPVRKQRPE